jgi:hypothetical protein
MFLEFIRTSAIKSSLNNKFIPKDISMTYFHNKLSDFHKKYYQELIN